MGTTVTLIVVNKLNHQRIDKWACGMWHISLLKVEREKPCLVSLFVSGATGHLSVMSEFQCT